MLSEAKSRESGTPDTSQGFEPCQRLKKTFLSDFCYLTPDTSL